MNLSTGAGFQPSTVSRPATTEKEKDKTDNAHFFPGRTNQLRSLHLTSIHAELISTNNGSQRSELTKSSFPATKKFKQTKKSSGVPIGRNLRKNINSKPHEQTSTVHQTTENPRNFSFPKIQSSTQVLLILTQL